MTDTVLMMEDIKKRLDGIFKKRFGVDIGAMKEEFKDKKLLGREIGMPPRDLLYLFFDIEKEFAISISQESIATGKFSTYSNICKIISNEMKNK